MLQNVTHGAKSSARIRRRKVVGYMKLRRTVAVAATVAIVSTVCVFSVVRADAKDVTVRYVDRFSGEEKAKEYKTQHITVRDFFDNEGIKKGEYDRLSHAEECELADGTEITITKAVPIVIKSGDSVVTTFTTMPTVSGALLETGMIPDEDDSIIPSAETPVTDGMEIVIAKVSTEEVVETEYIDFDTIYRDDANIVKGESKVVQNGKKGQEKVTYLLTYQDGELVSKEETDRLKVSDPESKIIARGTKDAPSPTPKPAKTETPKKTAKKTAEPKKADAPESNTIAGFKYTKKMEMTATAYSAFNSKGGYAKTASGMTARKGIVAVDRSVIPLGTRLYIEGYGEAIAGDVGGAIKGNKIDLCFEDTNKNLMKFGRQKVMVYILE